MRTCLSMISLCLALSSLSCLSASEHGIELTLSQTECSPGDVIELHAEMTRSDYAEFELKLPKNEALHFVTEQRSPINYSKGFYRQSAVWVFQPVRSGTIEWSGIRAVIKQGEKATEYELPPLQLEVRAYPSKEDSLKPERLPIITQRHEQANHYVWLAALLGVLGLGILYYSLRGKSKNNAAAALPAVSLENLLRALQSDTIPSDLIEELLTDEKTVLAPALRTALEAALYNPKANREALRSEIVKELQS